MQSGDAQIGACIVVVILGVAADIVHATQDVAHIRGNSDHHLASLSNRPDVVQYFS